jgi:hypothetical protein
VGLIVLFALLWLLGLRVCETIALVLYWAFGRGVERQEWFNAVYHSLRRMPRAAVVGSALWLAWLALFFLAGHPGGFALDVVFQIAGNAVGAWVYLPIVYRWLLLRKPAMGGANAA